MAEGIKLKIFGNRDKNKNARMFFKRDSDGGEKKVDDKKPRTTSAHLGASATQQLIALRSRTVVIRNDLDFSEKPRHKIDPQ